MLIVDDQWSLQRAPSTVSTMGSEIVPAFRMSSLEFIGSATNFFPVQETLQLFGQTT